MDKFFSSHITSPLLHLLQILNFISRYDKILS
nr:MAG TPA: hypothetical protein [Caudoviricetes sp.]